MSDVLKISGKRFTLPADSDSSSWKFEPRPGGWVHAIDPSGKRYRILAVELRGKLGFALQTAGNSQTALGEIVAKSHAAGAGSAQASIDADLTAQFPGKVRKILVEAGARVAEGDALLLLEAMKMEFAVKAPVSGKVTALRVKEGQQLSPGDRLLDFEPEKAGNEHGK